MPVITDSISVFNHILPNIAVRGKLTMGTDANTGIIRAIPSPL